ncbi:MAG TPA: hypothetical protein OIM00_07955 [Oscillospiraceae bacterium]|nr:hypothetical protein [Oscillospiraceae bacterium]
MNKPFKKALLVAFVTVLFGYAGLYVDDLLDAKNAVFSSVLAIAAAAASIVYYINKTKEEEKDDQE